MIETSYKLAKSAFDGRISRQDAIKILAKMGMNSGSAGDYISDYRCMRLGKRFERQMSIAALRYFLIEINRDNGNSAFETAIGAVERHLDYYEALEKGSLQPGKRKLLSELRSSVQVSDARTPEEVTKEDGGNEGARITITVNKYERDLNARKECIRLKGTSCTICLVNLEDVYGELAKGFVHIHHIVPLSELGAEYKVDPEKDLIPVCPNCHAMLHRQRPALKPERLKEKFDKSRNSFLQKKKA